MNVLKAALLTIFGAGALWLTDGMYRGFYAEIQAAPAMYRAIWVGYYVAFGGITCVGAYHTIRGLLFR